MTDDKDELIKTLRAEVATLKTQLNESVRDMTTTYYSSSNALIPREEHNSMPDHGMPVM